MAIGQMAQNLPNAMREALTSDLAQCAVEEVTADGSRLRFHLSQYTRPPYLGQHAYPVEGTVKDVDGEEMSVILYADENDRLLEFELLKWGEKRVTAPDWSTFRLS